MNWFDGIDEELAPVEREILARMELDREKEEKLLALIERAQREYHKQVSARLIQVRGIKKVVTPHLDYDLYSKQCARRDRMARLIQARRAGKVVSPYPGRDLYSKLCARRDRAADLAHYLEGARLFALEPVIVGDLLYEEDGKLMTKGLGGQPRKWLEPHNLPAKKDAYNRLKVSWLQAGLVDYSLEARRYLRAQEKEERTRIKQLDKEAQQGGDPTKAALSTGVIRELYQRLRQYVESDLSGLTPPAPPVVSGAAPTSPTKRFDCLRQVAIFYHLSEKPEIRNDSRACDIAAEELGLKSGPSLYNQYLKIKQPTGITGVEGKELPKMLADVKAVMPQLTKPEQQARAQETINILLKKIGKDDE